MYVIYRVEKFTRFPRQLSGLMHQPIETQQESSRCTHIIFKSSLQRWINDVDWLQNRSEEELGTVNLLNEPENDEKIRQVAFHAKRMGKLLRCDFPAGSLL